MALIATHFDMVLGVDLHWEMVPTPAGPVAMPFPNPFLGMVYDPKALAFMMAINNMVAAYNGQTPNRGLVLANSCPVAGIGDEAVSVLKHIIIPPGSQWAPLPQGLLPPIKPGDPPPPPSVGSPANNAMIIEGSDTCLAMGGSIAVNGVMLMSCAEPVRMPSSVLLAIPKGAPVQVGGPLSVSLLAAALGGLRSSWLGCAMRGLAHRILSRGVFARIRGLFARRGCHFTGHPVDIATGRLMTWETDWTLPGPLPLEFERIYSSAWAHRDSPLGYGWSHSLDQAVWREEEFHSVVYRDAEGRELEFYTDELDGRVMRKGDRLYDPINRLTLTDWGGGVFEIIDAEGITHEFAPIEGAPEGVSKLVGKRNRAGHDIRLYYNARGHLNAVRDSAGRRILFDCDPETGRLLRTHLPAPANASQHETHTRYEYSEAGELVSVYNPLNDRWTYEYDEGGAHLLVRETDPANLSWYFEYDGRDSDAFCTRTWGHGGIYDHLIDYDKDGRVTVVTNSHDEKTLYRMNPLGLVVEIKRPGLRPERFEYDDRNAQVRRHTDVRGGETLVDRDERGNVTQIRRPDGTTIELEFGELDNRPLCGIDPLGNEWRWRYDSAGRLVEETDPLGRSTRWSFREGLLNRVEHPGELVSKLEYDRHKNLCTVRSGHHSRQRVQHAEYDARGRIVRLVDVRGGVTTREYDPCDRLLKERLPDGDLVEHRYDRAGNLLASTNYNTRVGFEYDGYHEIAAQFWLDDDGREVGRVRFEHDLEGRLTAIVNENGERYELRRDVAGRVSEEVGFDGIRKLHFFDEAGQVIETRRQAKLDDPRTLRLCETERDILGRTTKVTYRDGSWEAFEYREDGELVEASNQDVTVRFELDPLGRLLREHQDGGRWVESGYGPDDTRVRVKTSEGHHVQIQRNVFGEPLELEAGPAHAPWRVRFGRDDGGGEVYRRLPGGVEQRWERSVDGLPETRTVKEVRGERIAHDVYSWDWTGQLRELVTANGHFTYRHDPRGRLEVMRASETGRPIWRSLDPAGNVHRNARANDHRYGPGGKLLGDDFGVHYAYDVHGNRIEKRTPDPDLDAPPDAELVTRYEWSDAGTLGAVELPDGRRIEYVYDALRRRVRRSTSTPDPEGGPAQESVTRWLWDGHRPIHEQTDLQEPITHLWEPDSFTPLGRFEGDERHAYLTDHLGNPAEGFDEQGQLLWRMTLDLFGVARTVGDASSCRWRFPGQHEDEDTGLFYNWNRYYDPEAGSYISQDPQLLLGGLNLYGYVDDPLNWLDPLGLSPWGNPVASGHHVVPHSGASHFDASPFDSRTGTPSIYFTDDAYKAGFHEALHGVPGSPERPPLTARSINKRGLTRRQWFQMLHRNYFRPEIQHIRGDLRLVASRGPGRVIARNVSPREAWIAAMQWARGKCGGG